ncbi:MAG: hypothetical protein Q8S53_09605 [Brevundimonas sp.]|uniref:hypothetical protein n=1 Tax=Brevundimonas sp. TaxID=1871086 RepID=UPI00273354A4|nr:hypothetical protein [Brevundimonas sp.]MDP3378610.1 hypothetical protein [Brevundimonas sp.]
MTAIEPNSTTVPAAAPMLWRDLWVSVEQIHPNAPDALRHAYAAGVDPKAFCLLELSGEGLDVPRMWFGRNWRGACRIFSPLGETASGVMGPIEPLGTIDSATGECHFDERLIP